MSYYQSPSNAQNNIVSSIVYSDTYHYIKETYYLIYYFIYQLIIKPILKINIRTLKGLRVKVFYKQYKFMAYERICHL